MSVIVRVKQGAMISASYIPDGEEYKPESGEVLLPDKDVWNIMDVATRRNRIYPAVFKTDTLKKVLERVFEIEEGTLNKRIRKERYSMARYMGMWLLYKYNYGSLKEIGSVFGRDHSTVLYALKVIQNLKDIKSRRWLNEINVIESIYEGGELHLTENEEIPGWIDSRERVTKDAV